MWESYGTGIDVDVFEKPCPPRRTCASSPTSTTQSTFSNFSTNDVDDDEISNREPDLCQPTVTEEEESQLSEEPMDDRKAKDK
jgi:hypothetical protein